MLKFVDELHGLHQVSTNTADKLVEVILMERSIVRSPEAHILEARWVFAERAKRRHLAGTKLTGEAGILRPKKSDIWDIKQNHGEALKTKTESPPNSVFKIATPKNIALHNPTPQDFKPVATEKNFQLNGRVRERKMGVDPASLAVSTKECTDEVL